MKYLSIYATGYHFFPQARPSDRVEGFVEVNKCTNIFCLQNAWYKDIRNWSKNI